MEITPTIPNADRTITYNPVGLAGPFPVPFVLFENTGADLFVTLEGEVVDDWLLTAEVAPGFYGAPNTWVNGSITFASPVTGELVIDGRLAPQRVSQFQEGRGVPARDLNTELNRLMAIARELFRRAGSSEDRLDFIEDERIPALLDLITASLGPGKASVFGSRAAMALASIEPVVTYAIATGYGASGDAGCLLTYTRAPSEPVTSGKVRSQDRFLPNGAVDAANGGWWVLCPDSSTTVEAFGAASDGATNDAAAILGIPSGIDVRVRTNTMLSTSVSSGARFILENGATFVGAGTLSAHVQIANYAHAGSIGQFRTMTVPAWVDTVLVAGYYGPGAPGGGVFVRHAADTTTVDDGGRCIVKGTVRWKRQAGGAAVTPDMFGVPGDGSLSISPMLGTVTSDDTVFLKAGTYLLGADVTTLADINLAPGATFSGSGKLNARVQRRRYPETHNFEGKRNLTRWKLARSSVKTGIADARIAMVGDSTTMGRGINKATPFFLAELMRKGGLEAYASNVWGAKTAANVASYSTYDGTVSTPSGTGWQVSGFNGWGGASFENVGTTGVLRFNPRVYNLAQQLDSFDLWFYDLAANGTVKATLDTAVTTNFATTGAGDLKKGTISGAVGDRYVDITTLADGAIYLAGVVGYNSTVKSVQVWNMGLSGVTVGGYAVGAFPWDPLNNLDQLAPELVVFNLGINDWLTGTSLSAFRSSYQSLITAAMAQSDVILVVPVPTRTTVVAASVQEQYRAAIYGLAYANDLPLIDLTSRFGEYTSALYGDDIHPTDIGYFDIAEKLTDVLLRA